MNIGTRVKAIVVLLSLIICLFLVRSYWMNIVPILEDILGTLKETRIRYFILAISTYILSVYFLAVRWQQVLSCIGYHIKALKLLPIYFGAIFITNITPGGNMAGGESVRILWVNKSFGISYTDAFKTVLFERLVEAIPIALLSIYVLYSSPSLEIKSLPLINSLTLNSTSLLLLTIFVTVMTLWFFRDKLEPLFMNVQKIWKQFKNSIFPVLFLSCGVWILDIIRLKLITLALNLNISINLIITVSILFFFLEALPLTPGGLGIVEGGLISLLMYSGLPLASAGSFVLLERFISYGLSSFIGFLCLFYGGFNLREKAKKEKLH